MHLKSQDNDNGCCNTALQPLGCDCTRGMILPKRSDGAALSAIDKTHPSITERIFTVVMLFYMAGAVLPVLSSSPDKADLPQIRPADLALKVALYAVGFGFIFRRWRSFIRGVWNVKWLVVLLLIAIASALWSQDPSLTLRGSAVLLATMAFGVYFGTRYTVRAQLRLLAWACSLMTACSYFLAIFLPRYGIEQDANIGAWKGAFIQKNNLAEATVLAVLVFLLVRPMRRSLRWLGIAASVGLLFLSGSATGMVVCFAIIATLPLYKVVRDRRPIAVPIKLGLGLLVTGLLLVLVTDTGEVLRLLNRTPDLTGRNELWDAVLLSITKRPWLGYGFSAFWQGMNGESGRVMEAVGWLPGFAHNGFLDLMLQLGVVGLAIFVLGYLALWRRAFTLLSRATEPIPIWPCTFLLFMLLYNITEGCILTQNDIYWVLYISIAVSLSPELSRRICIRSEDYPQ
jgi:exopolysaccharide production protein ExoQ